MCSWLANNGINTWQGKRCTLRRGSSGDCLLHRNNCRAMLREAAVCRLCLLRGDVSSVTSYPLHGAGGEPGRRTAARGERGQRGPVRTGERENRFWKYKVISSPGMFNWNLPPTKQSPNFLKMLLCLIFHCRSIVRGLTEMVGLGLFYFFKDI